MTHEPRTVAESHHYRPASTLERIGRAIGRLVGRGPVRTPLREMYYALQLAMTGGRGLQCTLPEGEIVRLLPRFQYATWNPFEYAAFRESLRAGDVAIDVGANIGVYTLLFGQWVGPRGRVYAFEPAAGARAGLAQHIALNRLGGVVVARPEAVLATAGTSLFSGDDANGANRVIAQGEPVVGDGAAVSVPTTTLDEFCRAHDVEPALLKIDVEGAELDVLRGARETLRRGRGHIAVFVELHPDIWPAFGVSRADMEAELRVLDLRAVALNAIHDPWTTNGECVRLVPR